jgi:hypothetical protein
MDAERRDEQTHESERPRFVWDLEFEHTKAVAVPGQAAPPAKVELERAEKPTAIRPRRRRILLPLCVAVAVIAGGTFAVVQFTGNSDAARATSSHAAEVGDAEYPEAETPSASPSPSNSSPKYVIPPKHTSPAPTHRSPISNPETKAPVENRSSSPKTEIAPPPPEETATSPHPVTVAKPAAPSTPAMPTVVEALSDQWSQCALLNGSCSVSLPSVVALGANGYFNYGTFQNATDCDYSVFGNPNASGQIACYREPTPTASSDVWTECATENGTCGFSGVMTIAFGANGDYHYATLGGGGTACTDAVFGDPDYGSAKACYLMAPPPQFTHWDLCASNGGTCKFSGTQEVAYGADGRYKYGSRTGSTPCTASALGNPNASGTTYCYVQDYYLY